MSPGSFDALSSLDKNLSKKGNEAESLVSTPEYCFVALRGFIGYVLQFLENRHSVPPPQAADLKDVGPDEFRINRLSNWGVRVTELELSALHNIRFFGNKGSHAAGNEQFFTVRNVEKALNSARLVRDWLCAQYVPPTSSGEERTERSSFRWTSATRQKESTANTASPSGWFDDVDIPRPQVSEPTPATRTEPSRQEHVPGPRGTRRTAVILTLILMTILSAGIMQYVSKGSIPGASALWTKASFLFDGGGSIEKLHCPGTPPSAPTTFGTDWKNINPHQCDLSFAVTRGCVELTGPAGDDKVCANTNVVGLRKSLISTQARATKGTAQMFYMLCPKGKGPVTGGWNCRL